MAPCSQHSLAKEGDQRGWRDVTCRGHLPEFGLLGTGTKGTAAWQLPGGCV